MKGIFAGMCGLDIIYYGAGALPQENTKGKYNEYGYAVGGPAANAAITYAALSGKAALITALGNSQLAGMIKGMLREANVEVIDLRSDSGSVNISAIYVNNQSASRTILSGQNPVTVRCDELVIPENGGFVEYDGSLPGIEEKLLDCGSDLVLDMGSDKESFLKCFSARTTAITSETYSHLGENIFALDRQYPLAASAITRGEKPLLFRDGDEIRELDGKKVNAVDTLGAGDIFHGAYCYYRYQCGCSFSEALSHAGTFASLSTEKRGVIAGVDHAVKTLNINN